MDYNWPLFMAGISDTWRKGRKILDSGLRSGAIMSYQQMIQEKARGFLAQLFEKPRDFDAHVEL